MHTGQAFFKAFPTPRKSAPSGFKWVACGTGTIYWTRSQGRWRQAGFAGGERKKACAGAQNLTFSRAFSEAM